MRPSGPAKRAFLRSGAHVLEVRCVEPRPVSRFEVLERSHFCPAVVFDSGSVWTPWRPIPAWRLFAGSGILLAGVLDVQDFDRFGADPVDENIVGRDDRFARVGNAPAAVHMGMIDQLFGDMGEQVGQAQRSRRITIRNIVDDSAYVLPRSLAPDDVRHQPRWAFLASMIARNSVITRSCGTPGRGSARLASTSALSHAS